MSPIMKPRVETEYRDIEERLPPPSTRKDKLKNPFLLILQIIYISLISVPLIMWSFIEKVFIIKEKSLQGKIVLVTGSGRGLGQGLALKFAELGCKVACADIDDVINKETVDLINEKYPDRAKGYVCNVCLSDNIKALRSAIKRDFGNVDILVNNAGMVCTHSILQVDDVYLNFIINTNLTSHILMLREFLPDMIERNEGHVVAMCSVSAFHGLAYASAYAATKHGILGLMDSVHYELSLNPGNNVKISTICPYFVNTSELYNKFCELRIPPLSIQETVDAAVRGIRRNNRVITIPAHLYFLLNFSKLLPDRFYKLLKSITQIKLKPIPRQFEKNVRLYKLLKKSMEKKS